VPNALRPPPGLTPAIGPPQGENVVSIGKGIWGPGFCQSASLKDQLTVAPNWCGTAERPDPSCPRRQASRQTGTAGLALLDSRLGGNDDLVRGTDELLRGYDDLVCGADE